jgi:hypothetical protein
MPGARLIELANKPPAAGNYDGSMAVLDQITREVHGPGLNPAHIERWKYL